MSARSRGRALALCASRAQMQTRPCKMLASSSVIMWSVLSSRLSKMDLLRHLFGVDLSRRRLVVACVHSGTMDSVDLVAEDRVVVIVVVLLAFRLGIGSEARGFQRVVGGVVVAGDGRRIRLEARSFNDRFQGPSFRRRRYPFLSNVRLIFHNG